VSGGRNIGLQTKNKRGNRGQTSRNGEKICSEDRTSQKLGVFPQPVKPAIFLLLGGMAEVMPFQNRVMKQLRVHARATHIRQKTADVGHQTEIEAG
jgi:hypothetical protein